MRNERHNRPEPFEFETGLGDSDSGLGKTGAFETALREFEASDAQSLGRVLTYTAKDVIDNRISIPAQHALVRLSKDPQNSLNAEAILGEIKAKRLLGIFCVNWQKPAKRARRLGQSWWDVIPPNEDAVLMLDPDHLLSGPPMIAFRRELDPDCGLLRGEKRFAAARSRLDAALLRAATGYTLWRGKNLAECASLSPPGSPVTNIVPPLFCDVSPPTVPDADLDELQVVSDETPAAWQQETGGSSYVRWVQESLNRILGLKLTMDGNAGPQTRSAIRTFQQQQGLKVDGMVGPATDAAIKAALSRPGAGPGYGQAPCSGLKSPEVLGSFEFNRDQVRPHHLPLIQSIAACIVATVRARPGPFQVRLVGHTDPVGTDAYNLQLARRRAEQIRQQLQQSIERIQSGASRGVTFSVETRGEREPVSGDAARSRRVEVFLPAQPKPGITPPRPLRSDEIQKIIKPRRALKSAASIPIELPLIVPVSAMPGLRLLTGRAEMAKVAGTGSASMTITAIQLQGTLGKQISPPGIEVTASSPLPRSQLKAVQREVRGLSGMLPDHLALLPLPASVPNELKAAPRINVQLPKQRPRDLHEPTTVFQPEDRKVFKDTSFPWSTIGRVETPGGVCSGAMIGPRHLLTCSHGIQWLPGGAGWVKFTPAYFDGGVPPFGFAYGIKIYFLRKVDGSDGLDRDEGQYDYAVVVLGSRLGDLTGWMGARSWSDSWDNQAFWSHAGYPSDITSAQRPTFQNGIALDGSFWDREIHTRIFHKGDVYPGQSGGPFFGWWSGESFPRVVAVQSGQSSDENSASGGADMVELVNRARRDFP